MRPAESIRHLLPGPHPRREWCHPVVRRPFGGPLGQHRVRALPHAQRTTKRGAVEQPERRAVDRDANPAAGDTNAAAAAAADTHAPAILGAARAIPTFAAGELVSKASVQPSGERHTSVRTLAVSDTLTSERHRRNEQSVT